MVGRHCCTRIVAVFFALTATGGTVSAATGGTELVAPLPTIDTDTTPPVVTAPVQTIAKGKAGTTVPIRLKWTASDAGGIKSYKLWRSTNGGAFVRDTLLAPTATSKTYLLPVDNSYRFFVRAYDNAGNASAAKYGPTFTPTIIDDRACCEYWTVAPYHPWTNELLTSAYNGTIKKLFSFRATTRGNYGHAVHDFTGRDVAYVAAVGSGWTSAAIKIDGIPYATVNLNRSTAAAAQIVFSKHWSTLGPHMIEIGTGGYGYINVDAIVVTQ
jgi:hypothetical protein